ncbi:MULTISPECIES: NupC/NupG family nucleoside CNT transporter [unclassified Sphingomonas]|uniref:NupC/NupG family nucleoside CNT transporter n=1 Tax=unclassified Sphingomonas TaxID=196159 RepID=UPI00082BC03B|nr:MULTISPECIES: nucleoside transporter C-terminal domain-containing protein [unclassified Sphingomonas]MCH4893300.1 NupC/NupG family nucleoside CNT transporter [Sphingomonas sp. SFZ2018-12]
MTRFLIGIAGIIVILAIAYALSANRRAIRLRVVGAAFALQAGIALLVLYVPAGKAVIAGMAGGVSALLGYASEGTKVIFGPIATDATFGTAFAVSALPVIIFFAALVAVLYHVGIMQMVVRWIGGAIEKVIGVSKVESLCAAANIFVGQSESPLVIRPYLASLTQPQMFAVMSVGMAGVAGTILAAYAALLGPTALPYLLAASFMSAPGGLLMAKMLMPDDPLAPTGELPLGDDREAQVIVAAEHVAEEERAANIIMAAAIGAQTGVKIAVAVAAMVLAFVSLVALANGLLGAVGGWFGQPDLTFQAILGVILSPVTFLLNIPWSEAQAAGGLLGTKVVLNEFVAFAQLGATEGLSPRTAGIITFALCGFANFSSIAIQMASAGSLAPNQRPVIAKLGIRALIAGTLANLMSAALAGMLLPG